MNVVILAAGTSRRLLPLTKHIPKALLPLSGSYTFLSALVENLKNNSQHISQLTIVGGHGFQFLQQAMASLDHIVPVAPTVVFNPNYQTMNNCYSLFMVLKEHMDHDLIVIHSDVVCHPLIVDKIMREPQTSLVVDTTKKLTAESMKVTVVNGRITDISKSLDAKTSYGEYIGIAKVQKKHLPKLRDALEKIVKETPNLFYDDAIRSILSDVAFRVVTTDGLAWTEVDNKYDLRVARSIHKALLSEIST